MRRDPRLVRLSWDHHHGLVMSRRVLKELPDADDERLAALYADLIRFWTAGLLPHFRVEGECLLARLVRHMPASSEPVARTLSDHLAIEALVANMRDAATLPERRSAMLTFAEVLRDHIRWEEDVLFDVTQTELSDASMDALAAEILEAIPEVVPAPFD